MSIYLRDDVSIAPLPVHFCGPTPTGGYVHAQFVNLLVLCNMQLNVLNDLARAKRRWTKKKTTRMSSAITLKKNHLAKDCKGPPKCERLHFAKDCWQRLIRSSSLWFCCCCSKKPLSRPRAEVKAKDVGGKLRELAEGAAEDFDSFFVRAHCLSAGLRS